MEVKSSLDESVYQKRIQTVRIMVLLESTRIIQIMKVEETCCHSTSSVNYQTFNGNMQMYEI